MGVEYIIDVSEHSKDFFELSNSFNYEFEFDGFLWRNGECCFQAMKQKQNTKIFNMILKEQNPKMF